MCKLTIQTKLHFSLKPLLTRVELFDLLQMLISRGAISTKVIYKEPKMSSVADLFTKNHGKFFDVNLSWQLQEIQYHVTGSCLTGSAKRDLKNQSRHCMKKNAVLARN